MHHLHDKGNRDAACHSHGGIKPPEPPCYIGDPGAPVRADEYKHVYQCCILLFVYDFEKGYGHLTCERHWECPNEERLCLVTEHCTPYLRIQRVPYYVDRDEDYEENKIEDEKGNGYAPDPICIPG